MRQTCTLKGISLALVFSVCAIGMTGCGGGNSTYVPERVAGPATPVPDLPNSFQIVEKAFAWGATFDVKNNGRNEAQITEKLWSWGRTFRYTDNQGRLVATAHAKPFSWGVEIEVFDSTGAKIGTIKEDLTINLFRTYTLYHILDSNGKEVALSKKYQFFSTDIDLTSPRTGALVANLHRNAWNLFGDTWTVTIHNREGVDPRLLVMISAFKTAEDNDKSHDD